MNVTDSYETNVNTLSGSTDLLNVMPKVVRPD